MAGFSQEATATLLLGEPVPLSARGNKAQHLHRRHWLQLLNDRRVSAAFGIFVLVVPRCSLGHFAFTFSPAFSCSCFSSLVCTLLSLVLAVKLALFVCASFARGTRPWICSTMDRQNPSEIDKDADEDQASKAASERSVSHGSRDGETSVHDDPPPLLHLYCAGALEDGDICPGDPCVPCPHCGLVSVSLCWPPV